MSESSRGMLLIVEDEPSKCATLRSELIEAGYTVKEAFNNNDALNALATHRFHAVLTEVRGGAGLSLLETIRKQYPSVRVIVMAAHPSVESAVACMKRGASDYLPKPVRCSTVIQSLDEIFDRATHLPEPAGGVEKMGVGAGAPVAPNMGGRMVSYIPAAETSGSSTGGFSASLTETIAGIERRMIQEALQRAAGNQAKAAQFLSIPRTTLRDKMAKYGMVGEPVKRELQS